MRLIKLINIDQTGLKTIFIFEGDSLFKRLPTNTTANRKRKPKPSRTRKIAMQPFETLPTTAHIKLIVHVYPLGGVDVRYAPEEGDAPMQRAALFGSRSGLAKKLEGLGLHEEADIIIHSDAQFHFTFLVANKPKVMDSFEFSKSARLLG